MLITDIKKQKRIKTGLAFLDEMLAGGVFPGSIITLAGGVSTGKTLLGLKIFLSKTFSSRKKKLLVSFDENPAQIVDLLKYLKAANKDRVDLEDRPSIEKLKKIILTEKPEVIFVNSINSLSKKTKELLSFLSLVRESGAVAILSYSFDRVEKELPSSDEIIQHSDCVFLLENKRVKGRDKRLIKLAKMRGSGHGEVEGELFITKRGVLVEESSFVDQETDENPVLHVCLSFGDIEIETKILKEFKKLNPDVTVSLYSAKEEDTKKFLAEVNQGVRRCDVFACWLSEVKELAAAHSILPIDSYINWVEADRYAQNVLDTCKYEGRLFGLPFLIRTFGLMYRKDILSKIKKKIPETWDELVETSQLALASENGITEGIVYPDANNSLILCFLGYLLANGKDIDKILALDFSGEECRQVFQFMRDCIYKYGVVSTDNFDKGWSVQIEKYIKGQGLFLHTWESEADCVLQYNHAMKGKIGFANFPKGPSGAHGSSFYTGSAYVIPVSAKLPIYAASFIKLVSSYEMEKEIVKLGNFPFISARKDICEEQENSGEKYYYENAGLRLKNGYLIDDLWYDPGLTSALSGTVVNAMKKENINKEELEELNSEIHAWKKRNYYSKAVDEAKIYIERRYNKKITLKEVADSVKLSRFHFSRIFKEKTGMTVFDYLTVCRVNRAKVLLLEAYKSNLSEIAIKLGFSGLNHFSRVFKAQTGITPSQMRLSSKKLQ